MIILGIETSCDDTGIAIYDSKYGVIINKVFNQFKIHAPYRGIVPELASREHLDKISLIVNKTILESKIDIKDINGISYTAGPGMVGALMVGATFACSYAYALNIPAIPVNHIEGHILSPMMIYNHIKFPFNALLISGGNTQIIQVNKYNNYKILGETLDDSLGETFDKIAQLMGLKFPGGAKLSELAQFGIPNKYKMPLPMINQNNLNFSFSGLKTHVFNIIKKTSKNKQILANIARSFEDTVLKILINKCIKAVKLNGFKKFVIVGGG